jgi:uncharacterized damage-inducible protein DinB
MKSTDHFHRMFTYDHWANRECLSALDANAPPANALRFIAHILSAQQLWLERLRHVSQSVAVWPSSTIQQCLALNDEMLEAWKQYLSALPANGMDSTIEYRNSKGDPWSSRVEDVLIHVLMHSAYHRGQVALEMRSAGKQPAYTDFVHAVRQGFVD